MTNLTKDYQKIRSSFFLALTIEGRSKHTLELYEYTLKSFEKFLGDKTPLEAETNDIRQYLLALSQRNYAKATIYTHHKQLKAVYNFLVAEDFLAKQPMANIKAPQIPRCYPYVLSEEDVLKLLRIAKGRTYEAKRNYAIVLFLLDTGIRVSELINLKLDDVNLATLTAKIIQGKGSKDRVVHFSKQTGKSLSSYLKARGVNPYEDRFIISKQGEPIKRHAVLRMIKRLGVKAGIAGKRVSPHTFRHTFATFWIKNGGDPVSLQRQLGQSDPKMVQTYVNLVGRDLKEAHSKYSPLKRLI